jgi:hypothetical protein
MHSACWLLFFISKPQATTLFDRSQKGMSGCGATKRDVLVHSTNTVCNDCMRHAGRTHHCACVAQCFCEAADCPKDVKDSALLFKRALEHTRCAGRNGFWGVKTVSKQCRQHCLHHPEKLLIPCQAAQKGIK